MLRSLAILDWPTADREAWEAACRPTVRLRRGGSAAGLAPITRNDLQRRYGYFLKFLMECGRFDALASCSALLTPANISPFVERMRNEWSATTLVMTIQKLYQIARHLAPLTDFKWLWEIARDVKAEDGPVRRRPVVDASELLIAGLSLVEEHAGSPEPMDLTAALNIRNGLMVALLASCPIRAKNLAGLTLGRTLHFSGSCWWIDLPASVTKNGRPDCRALPEFLTSALDAYLRQARPVLLGGFDPRTLMPWPAGRDDHDGVIAETGHACQSGAGADIVCVPRPNDGAPLGSLSGPLWVSRYGARMTYSSIHHALTSATESTVGIAVAPHGFRRAAATTAAWKAGATPNLASAILQHMDRRTTEASYIRATSFEAAQRLGAMLRPR